MRSAWAFTLSLACVTACEGTDINEGRAPDAGAPDAGKPRRTLDRSRFAAVATSGKLDYATPEHWVCRPDIEPDECARNIDATEIKPDGSFEVHEHEPAARPAFDCFYVYPTVWIAKSAQMDDFSDTGVELVLDPLLSQAARFTSLCRVYAPMYRQAGLSGVALTPGADKQLALQDVRDAFAYYLEHDNAGRKFVLIGHSQGAYMLSSLLARDIDDDPVVRARLISALLLGGSPYAAPGERSGGSFKNIPSCAQPGETGCVIAYNSYAAEAPPTANALFGRVGETLANEPVDLSGQVICTEPAALAGHGGKLRGSYFPQKLNNAAFGTVTPVPGVDTPFTLYRDLLRGRCETKDGRSYLSVSAEPAEGETRALPAYRSALLESIGFGMHLVDYSIALEDLMTIVKAQAAAAR